MTDSPAPVPKKNIVGLISLALSDKLTSDDCKARSARATRPEYAEMWNMVANYLVNPDDDLIVNYVEQDTKQ